MHQTSKTYAYFQSVYEGQQKLNSNGTFIQSDYTIYGRDYNMGVYSYNPTWKFLDSEGTYAADQYGRIAKFNYNADTTMGVDREIVLNLSATVTDYVNSIPYTTSACRVRK